MTIRILSQRLKRLEARTVLPPQRQEVHTILFLAAEDKTVTLTLQLGPNSARAWPDLADPSNPLTWTETRLPAKNAPKR